MPVPLIPIVTLAAKVSWPVVLKVLAATTVVGGTGGIAYELGKEKGKYEGEKVGRVEQARTDKEKFYQQEGEFRRQKEKLAKEKEELEEILECYEAIIEELSKKHHPTEEDTVTLDNAIAEHAELIKLHTSYDDIPHSAAESSVLRIDYYNNDKEGLAAVALYLYFSQKDKLLEKEYPFERFTLSEKASIEAKKIQAIKPLLFSEVRPYLSTISNVALNDLRIMVDIFMESGVGSNEVKRSAKEFFDKYLRIRAENPSESSPSSF